MTRPEYWNLPKKHWTAEERDEYFDLLDPRPAAELPTPLAEIEDYAGGFEISNECPVTINTRVDTECRAIPTWLSLPCDARPHTRGR